MLYYLHLLSEQPDIQSALLKGFNVFQYITFRSMAAGVTAFIICLLFGRTVIRRLISLKLGQPIRTEEEVNRLHELHGAKAGTTTMGVRNTTPLIGLDKVTPFNKPLRISPSVIVPSNCPCPLVTITIFKPEDSRLRMACSMFESIGSNAPCQRGVVGVMVISNRKMF
jgi:hypothetical protein